MAIKQNTVPIIDPSEITNDINGFNVVECEGVEPAEVIVLMPNLAYGFLSSIYARYLGYYPSEESRPFYTVSPGDPIGLTMSIEKQAELESSDSVRSFISGDDSFFLWRTDAFDYTRMAVSFPVNLPCQESELEASNPLRVSIPMKLVIDPASSVNYQQVREAHISSKLQAELLMLSLSVAENSMNALADVAGDTRLVSVSKASLCLELLRTASLFMNRKADERRFASPVGGDRYEIAHTADEQIDYLDVVKSGDIVPLSIRPFINPGVFVLLNEGDGKRLYHSESLTRDVLESIRIVGRSNPPRLGISKNYVTTLDYQAPDWMISVDDSVFSSLLSIGIPSDEVMACFDPFYVTSGMVPPQVKMHGLYLRETPTPLFLSDTTEDISLKATRPPLFSAGELIDVGGSEFIVPFSMAYLLPFGSYKSSLGLSSSGFMDLDDVLRYTSLPIYHRTAYPSSVVSRAGTGVQYGDEFAFRTLIEQTFAADAFTSLRSGIEIYRSILERVPVDVLASICTRVIRGEGVEQKDVDEAMYAARLLIGSEAPRTIPENSISFVEGGDVLDHIPSLMNISDSLLGWKPVLSTAGSMFYTPKISVFSKEYEGIVQPKDVSGLYPGEPFWWYKRVLDSQGHALFVNEERLMIDGQGMATRYWDASVQTSAPSSFALRSVFDQLSSTVRAAEFDRSKLLPYVISSTPDRIYPADGAGSEDEVTAETATAIRQSTAPSGATGVRFIHDVFPVVLDEQQRVSFSSIFSTAKDSTSIGDSKVVEKVLSLVRYVPSLFSSIRYMFDNCAMVVSGTGTNLQVIFPRPAVYAYDNIYTTVEALSDELDISGSMDEVFTYSSDIIDSILRNLESLSSDMASGSISVSAVEKRSKRIISDLSDWCKWAKRMRQDIITYDDSTKLSSLYVRHFDSVPSETEIRTGGSIRVLKISRWPESLLHTSGFWFYNIQKIYLMFTSLYDLAASILSRSLILMVGIASNKGTCCLSTDLGETTEGIDFSLFTSGGIPVHPFSTIPADGIALSGGPLFTASRFVNSIVNMFSDGTLYYKMTINFPGYNGTMVPVIMPGLGLNHDSPRRDAFGLDSPELGTPGSPYSSRQGLFVYLDGDDDSSLLMMYRNLLDPDSLLEDDELIQAAEEVFEHLRVHVSDTDYMPADNDQVKVYDVTDGEAPVVTTTTRSMIEAYSNSAIRRVNLREVSVNARVHVDSVIPYPFMIDESYSANIQANITFKPAQPSTLDASVLPSSFEQALSIFTSSFTDVAQARKTARESAARIMNYLSNGVVMRDLTDSTNGDTYRQNSQLVVVGRADQVISALPGYYQAESLLVVKMLSMLLDTNETPLFQPISGYQTDSDLASKIGGDSGWEDEGSIVISDKRRNYNLYLSMRRAHVVSLLIATSLIELTAGGIKVTYKDSEYVYTVTSSSTPPSESEWSGAVSMRLFSVYGFGSILGKSVYNGGTQPDPECRGVTVSAPATMRNLVGVRTAVSIYDKINTQEKLVSYIIDKSSAIPSNRMVIWDALSPEDNRTLCLPKRTQGQWITCNSVSSPVLTDGFYQTMYSGLFTPDSSFSVKLREAVDRLDSTQQNLKIQIANALAGFVGTYLDNFEITSSTGGSSVRDIYLHIREI